MEKRILAGGIVLLALLLAVGPVGQAAPLFQAQSMITYPSDGATVSGQVEIRGVARHPNMDFYQLRYAPGPQPEGGSQWQDFAIVEGQQVENDVLGTWDTGQLPDGQYTLALAVWGVNDPNNPYVYFVTNVTVDSSVVVDTPTPEVTPTEEAPTPTAGPTPTPESVEQPPTPTPRPTPTRGAGAIEETPTASSDDGLDLGAALRLDQLSDGFCTGGLVSLIALGLWGAYVVAKAGVRWFLRQRSRSSSEMGR